ncbi:MAG: hypothetical protein KKD18_04300 [Nanoarchaeota archaeon]|nr:hypothetical protein [Nanoarchaeota archaeon]
MKKRIIIFILGALVVSVFLIRLFSKAHLDDVTPAIPCDEKLYDHAGILWVIPKFNSINISDNPEWCKKILALNKTIGMHGVYHSYREFMTFRDEEYVNEGVEEFEKCFGFKPTLFKAPQDAYNKINKESMGGLHVVSYFELVFHKEFHCNNEGVLPNWVFRIF